MQITQSPLIPESLQLTSVMDRYLMQLTLCVKHKDRRGLDRLIADNSVFTTIEWSLLLDILREWRNSDGQQSSVLDDIWQIDFKEKPVDIENFLHDEFYYGRHVDGIFPVWVDELKYVCDPKNGIREWLFTGSLGCGKSTTATLANIYMGPYRLSHLRNPSEYYGLQGDSPLVFGIYSLFKYASKDLNFMKMRNMLDQIPYFREKATRNMRKSEEIEWPESNLKVVCGSDALHTIGQDVFSVLMDEANFMKENVGRSKTKSKLEEEAGQAQKLYDETRARLDTRFARLGVPPGLMMILSSRKSQDSWLEKHIREHRTAKGVHVSEYAIWEAKPPVDRNGRVTYTGKKFIFRLPTRNDPGKVLDEDDILHMGDKWIKVPVEHAEVFRRMPLAATRNYAGLATEGFNQFFETMTYVEDCTSAKRKNPFPAESLEIGLHSPKKLSDYYNRKMVCLIRDSVYLPKHYPTLARAIHVDGSISGDATGIAMVCACGVTIAQEFDATTGEITQVLRNKVMVDFVLQITAPRQGAQRGKISMLKIVEFIHWLRSFLNYPIQKVTYDGFQSEYQIQLLESAGFEAKNLSVDKTTQPYETLKAMYQDGSINQYHHQLLYDELSTLEEVDMRGTRWKIDHPPNGTKDVADSLAGACYNAMNFEVAGSAEVRAKILNQKPRSQAVENVVEFGRGQVDDYSGRLTHIQQGQGFVDINDPEYWSDDNVEHP